jgi:hypothetical protein
MAQIFPSTGIFRGVLFSVPNPNPDPYHLLTDPYPALFVSDRQDANKKKFFLSFIAFYFFLKVHVHHASKKKVIKK